MRLRLRPFLLSLGLLTLAPSAAEAFCGFYVSGADAKLFNNATVVALMREGTRTVLSMQNNYQGPPSGFAMVVPVPVVLQRQNVKTLPHEVFSRLDSLAAPRLVEYWEMDPCQPTPPDWENRGKPPRRVLLLGPGGGGGVRVEAKFEVGEYEVVVLSASDSVGLDKWLRQEKYKIPDGAEPFLRPYVQAGMKFFVAKVNPAKVKLKNGSAMLSPLRFHYDAETFSLPVRLGLINSAGTQDLLVHIIAKDQRYDVANYPNVTIPTNIDVAEGVKGSFGAFYAALFDRTLEKKPGAVVTEYAWAVSKCDPCAPDAPGMSSEDLLTLGAEALPSVASTFQGVAHYGRSAEAWDVMRSPGLSKLLLDDVRWDLSRCYNEALKRGPTPESNLALSFRVVSRGAAPLVSLKGSSSDPMLSQCSAKVIRGMVWPKVSGVNAGTTAALPILFHGLTRFSPEDYVITRLHARYGKESLGEDLVFRTAPPLSGGREVRDADGKLDQGAVLSGGMGFQGRYAIRHPWTGPIVCDNPSRGRWGPPPGAWQLPVNPASNIAFAPRGGVDLLSLVKEDVPAIGLSLPAAPLPPASPAASEEEGSPPPAATAKAPKAAAPPPPLPPPSSGCAACAVPKSSEAREGDPGSTSGAASGLSAAAAVLCAALRRLRRVRRGGGGAELHARLDAYSGRGCTERR